MRLVLDTNALIAAFVARGTCSDLLEYAVRTHTVVCSWYILDELREKLVDKVGVTASEARRAAALLAERFEQVERLRWMRTPVATQRIFRSWAPPSPVSAPASSPATGTSPG